MTSTTQEWRDNNREHIRAYGRRWAKEHPKAHNEHNRKQRYNQYNLTKEQLLGQFEMNLKAILDYLRQYDNTSL